MKKISGWTLISVGQKQTIYSWRDMNKIKLQKKRLNMSGRNTNGEEEK